MEYVYKISVLTREFYSRIFMLGRFKCIFFSIFSLYYSLNVLILAIKWYIITWLNYVKMLSFFFTSIIGSFLMPHLLETCICKWVIRAARGKQRLSWRPSHILHCAGRILKHKSRFRRKWNEILPTDVCRRRKLKAQIREPKFLTGWGLQELILFFFSKWESK